MAGTLTPTPYQTVLDGDGVAVSGAKITTTDTGTGVAASTYTNADLSVANTNPIVADSAGRYVAYLPAGANLTFAITTSADVAIETQTNIQSVPGSSVNLDVEGTVGEAVTAGQVLYLSSAAEATPLTAGLWYLTDADAAPTSTTPQSIGVAVSAIAINAAGTIRLAGLVTTSGAVVVGTTYYVSATAGALASSAPALSRQVGVAMTTSSLLLAATTAIVSALPNPITQDLLFTDATYDIGKSGASRPRDLFASRNAAVGGTLGVSGATTLSADLVVTGSSAISGVEIDNTATDGDPTLAFTLSGTSLFTMGVDDGDSDKFKIGTTAIGTSTSLTIDGSQNITAGADLTVTGDIVVSGAGPHAIGGATDPYSALVLRTAFTSDGSSSVARGFDTDRMTVTGVAGDTTHILGSLFSAAMTVQNVSETVIDVAQVMIDEPAITKGASATITNSSSLKITGAATEATNNYAMWVDEGVSRFDGSIDLVGGQITFPGTQVASSNVNTLDDYEEGSWTPVLGGNGGQSGQAYAEYRDGHYVKIGKVVTITFHFKLTTEGTITGDCQIKDLPFTARTVSGGAGACNSGINWSGLSTSYVNIRSQVYSNATVAGLRAATAAATGVSVDLSSSDVQDNTAMSGMYVYETSA